MKKFLSIILAAVLLLSVGAAAFADTGDITITYALRSNGENDIVVNTGDIITVAYLISASEEAELSVTQNEIYYDHSFFELVEGSNKQSEGFDDYITSVQERLSSKQYVFFNTITTHVHGTEPVEIGTMQFKVIATGGETTIASTNPLATDLSAVLYKSTTSDLHVSVGTKQAQKFTVIFKNDGAEEFQRVTVEAGQSITIPEGPEKMYYNFLHWMISGNSEKYLPGDEYVPTSDVTFNPNWIMKSGLPEDEPTREPDPEPAKESKNGLFLILALLLLVIILVVVYLINAKKSRKKHKKHRR